MLRHDHATCDAVTSSWKNSNFKAHGMLTPVMQTSLFPMKTIKAFGGSLLKGKRKSARPLSSKHPIHLVLHSQIVRKAGGFLRHQKFVRQVIERTAKKWGVNVYDLALAIDHIHSAVRIPNREAYRRFIQSVTGTIALELNPSPVKCDFWDVRPFTRIVEWGKAFGRLKKYIKMNVLEASGEIHYQPRGRGSSAKRSWSG